MALFRKRLEYARVNTHMNFDLRLNSGSAAVTWEHLEPHPSFSWTRRQIALAGLLYGRTLVNHEPTRAELFMRMDRYATELAEGLDADLEPWFLDTNAGPMVLWPWTSVDATEIGKAKTYRATLVEVGRGRLGIHLKMAFGMENVLAPSAAIIPIVDLAGRLDESARKCLGAVLQAMNRYHGSPDGFGRIRSEISAFEAAMPILVSGTS